MVDPDLKRELWELMHESHMRTSVYRKMQARYMHRSRAVFMLQAIAASSAVGGWALWSYQIGAFKMQWLAASFLGIVAVTSIVHPALDWPVIVTASRIVARGWAKLNFDVETVWRNRKTYSSDEVRGLLREFGVQVLWLNEIETELPRDTTLARVCYNEAKGYYVNRR